jgi:hypothetical protein
MTVAVLGAAGELGRANSNAFIAVRLSGVGTIIFFGGAATMISVPGGIFPPSPHSCAFIVMGLGVLGVPVIAHHNLSSFSLPRARVLE